VSGERETIEQRLYAAERDLLKAVGDRLTDFRIQHGYRDNKEALDALRMWKKGPMTKLIRAAIRWEEWQKKR
jgi:hypothetical protein